MVSGHSPMASTIAPYHRAAGAALEIRDAESLAAAVRALLGDATGRHAQAAAARTVAEDKAGVLDKVFDALGPLLDRAISAEAADARS